MAQPNLQRGALNVDYLARDPGSSFDWRTTDMALQQGLGILPEWRIRTHRPNPVGTCFERPRLVRRHAGVAQGFSPGASYSQRPPAIQAYWFIRIAFFLSNSQIFQLLEDARTATH